MLLCYYLDHVRLCCYLVGMDFFSTCVMVVSYVHVSHMYISWSYIFYHTKFVLCILTYSSHAHNKGELNSNRNINILCILALMFVNAKIIYCNCDTTCVIVINKQKGGD